MIEAMLQLVDCYDNVTSRKTFRQNWVKRKQKKKEDDLEMQSALQKS